MQWTEISKKKSFFTSFSSIFKSGQKGVKTSKSNDDKKKEIEAKGNSWARKLAPRSGDVSNAVCDEEKFAAYTGLKLK